MEGVIVGGNVSLVDGRFENAEHCVCCGAVIPEGSQVCIICGFKANFKQSIADVVEVRHGKWIMRGGRFRCSECDGKALMQDIGGTGGFSHEFEQVKSDFCPHCGAKMDLEEENK